MRLSHTIVYRAGRPLASSRLPGLRLLRQASSGRPREPLLPPAPTSSHNNLHSFLEYANRTNLNPKSTVYVGTHYEYTVAGALSRYGLSLQRVGGASDFGIDLLGAWALPSAPAPLRVLVQCKAGAIGPHVIRELEGAFVGAPVGWKGAGVLGVLAARKPATKGVSDALARSKWPMVFVCCSADGAVTQVRWNQRAALEGLEGVHVTVRHSEGGGEPRIALTWRGEAIPAVDADEKVQPE